LKAISAKNKKQSFIIMLMGPLSLIAIYYLIQYISLLSVNELDFSLADCDQNWPPVQYDAKIIYQIHHIQFEK
jgi:hypothetical protein